MYIHVDSICALCTHCAHVLAEPLKFSLLWAFLNHKALWKQWRHFENTFHGESRQLLNGAVLGDSFNAEIYSIAAFGKAQTTASESAFTWWYMYLHSNFNASGITRKQYAVTQSYMQTTLVTSPCQSKLPIIKLRYTWTEDCVNPQRYHATLVKISGTCCTENENLSLNDACCCIDLCIILLFGTCKICAHYKCRFSCMYAVCNAREWNDKWNSHCRLHILKWSKKADVACFLPQ